MAEERRSSRPSSGGNRGGGAAGRGGAPRDGKPGGQGGGRGSSGGAGRGTGKPGAGRTAGSKSSDWKSGDRKPSERRGASDRTGSYDRTGSGERKGSGERSERGGYDSKGPGERKGSGERSERGGYDRKGPGERKGSGERSERGGYDRKGPGERKGSGERSERGGYDRKRSDRPAGDRRGPQRQDRSGDRRGPRPETAERSAEQRAYDGPDLPEWVTGKELDRSITAQLKGLPEKLAARVARHLAAAGALIDSDPEQAYQHAKAAKSRAQRLAVVREALGEAAYAAGHYAEALAELRAAKRMNGATAYLPIMADCHRALGQPEQALKLAQSPSVANFIPEAKAEMTIVEAGARRDMGQFDAALRVLEQAPLMSKSRASWVVRLRYAYADTLEAAGRPTDALTWFHRTFAIDADELTDAAERAAALESGRD